MANLHVEIITPQKKAYEGSAYMVVVPAISGDMGFLPGHVSVMSELGKGNVVVSDSANSDDPAAKKFAIEGGYVNVSNDTVIVLAEKIISDTQEN